jgi:hypothetical protein
MNTKEDNDSKLESAIAAGFTIQPTEAKRLWAPAEIVLFQKQSDSARVIAPDRQTKLGAYRDKAVIAGSTD